jgi:predicted AlkP superfamily pyrophosphatase or phosphodiesterase
MRSTMLLLVAGSMLAGCTTTPATRPTRPVAVEQAPAVPPKLLVVISVDQLSADLLDEYRSQFTSGLARVANGAAYRNGYQSHAATETCPGHSTILTGSHPARNGIIANNWVDYSVNRPSKSIYCAEDERLPPPNPAVPPGSWGSYVPSPVHLRVQTLGDLLKQTSPQSLNVAVAGKDRAAIMMSGHRADQRWFWDGGKFTTDLAGSPMPQAVQRGNAAVAAAIALPNPGLTSPPFCAAKFKPVRLTNTLTVGNGNFARAAGDSRAYRVSPESDGAVLAIAAGLVQEMRLGADASPDVLSIGLSATDYVGHGYGLGGQEMCLQLLALDRSLGDFFRVLDSQGIDYAVALTADHGGTDIPERRAGAARADPALEAENVAKTLGAQLGLSGPIVRGDVSGDIYIDRSLSPAQRARVEQAALAFYRAHPQVEAVFTARDIASRRVPTGSPDRWSIADRVRASFDPQRSGNLYVVLKQSVSPIPAPSTGYVATHGTVWDSDRRVPILFWRKGMSRFSSDSAVDTVDIMPTLAAMIGLPLALSSVDGRCLIVQGVLCPIR